MIVDFKDIRYDAYGRLEQPVLLLQTMAGQNIMPLTNYYNLSPVFRLNDVSEITFDISDTVIVDDMLEENPAYDAVIGMRIIEMEPFGPFILMNPEISDDGVKRVKSCTAYSLEYELNFKFINVLNTDGVGFPLYDPTGLTDSIMGLIMEKIPNWSIGHVDPSLYTRIRDFSETSEAIYSFMMNTLQETYNCMFVFDTKNRIINIYDASDDVRIENLPIYISHENLIKDIKLKELSDEIVTCLGVYGADNISIASVNPLANEKIYNIDYFIEQGDIPDELVKKWKNWKLDYKICQKLFSQANNSYQTYSLKVDNQNAVIAQLQEDLKDVQSVLEVNQTMLADGELKSDEKTALNNEIKKNKTEKTTIESKIKNAKEVLSKLEKERNSVYSVVSECTNAISLTNYFTDYEYAILNAFFKEDKIQDNNFIASTISSNDGICSVIDNKNTVSINIKKASLYESDDYTKLTDSEWKELKLDSAAKNKIKESEAAARTYLGRDFYTIDIGEIEVAKGNTKITGKVHNSTLSVSESQNGESDIVLTMLISGTKYTDADGTEKYENATLVYFGKAKNLKYKSGFNLNGSMSLTLVDGNYTVTFDNTIYQQHVVLQQLYDYGLYCSERLAYPSYEFSINSSNFIFSEEFEPFKNMISLGKSINVEFNEDIFKRPILIEVSLDYEDLTSLNLTFSNKFRINSPEFLLADIIGKTATTTSNLDANKFSYAAYSKSSVRNDVNELMTSALDVSKREIINSKDQNFLVDDAGVHLRKLSNPVTGEFDPAEIRLINNKIVFTNNGWESADLAIGKLTTPAGHTTMGVVADSLIGRVIAGNDLIIQANKNGSDGVMTFAVNGSGAYIGNGTFAMEDENPTTDVKYQMMLDPRYGFAMGGSMFDMNKDGVDIKDTFFTEVDDFGMPKNANVFMDIRDGSAMFRGTVFADSGYFAGTLSAENIIERNDDDSEKPTVGNLILRTIPMYKYHTSNTSAPTPPKKGSLNGWGLEAVGQTDEKKYLWSVNDITYVSGVTEYTSPVCISGNDGKDADMEAVVEQAKTTASTVVDNLNIGGRNLLCDTDAPSLTKVSGPANRYFANNNKDYAPTCNPSIVSISDSPIGSRYAVKFP